MCRLPYPVQGSQESTIDLRSCSSLAQDLVAGLQDLPEGTAGPCAESSGTGVTDGSAGKADGTGHEVAGSY